ncbi:MAG: hypothetical protein N3E49_06940 [Bacteroidia bacterium]|nr:hypothetical protein [Bacteroidia bacterium]
MRWIIWMILLLGLMYGQDKTSQEGSYEEDFLEDIFSEPPLQAPKPDTIPLQADSYSLTEDTVLNPPKPFPPLRLIDSPIQRSLPVGGNTRITLSTNRPFLVQIVRPKLQNAKGYPLIYGFDTWYLYIVKAEQVRVRGKTLQTNGLPVYLTIVSSAKTLEDIPTVVESTALMIKGLVDYGDTIVKHFKREKKRLKITLDSLLAQPIPDDEIQAEEQRNLIERVADSLDYAESYYELYRNFKRAKASEKALVQFFLTYPFNRSLSYSIYSAPYALPRYAPPKEESPPPISKRKRS